MYRVLSTQKCNIYCEEHRCNQSCGLFHREDVKQKSRKSLRDRRGKQFRVQSLDMTKNDVNGDKKPGLVLSANSEGQYHQVSYLNIQQPNAIEPITPLSSSSIITLDDIISSAKRKISNHDYVDLRIPSPVFIDDSDTEGVHPLAKQRNLIGGTPWPKDIYQSDESSHKEDDSFVDHLVNSSDEDDHWMEYNPPSIIEDGEQEDFDELLKITQAPVDHYSNPLYKNADKLTKVRRKKSDFDDASSASLSIADISMADYDLNFALLQTRLNDVNEKVQYEGNL